MKQIFSILTIIGLLTFCLTGSLSAERLLYEHTVNKENKSVEVTRGHPWWAGDGDLTTRDGDIMVSAEKRIFDVSASQAKSSVSSSVSISCNVDDGSFVGVAQIKGTADTGVSAFLASSYKGIADSGIPETLSTSDLDTYRGKSGNKDKDTYTLRLPGRHSSLLYSGIKRHGVSLKKGFSAFGVNLFSQRKDLSFDASASTVKQKSVGATNADIIAMFSPSASASGSAENNAGQGIGNQVPSSSADTGMEGNTRNLSDNTPNCQDCTSDCSSPCNCTNSGTCGGTVSTPPTGGSSSGGVSSDETPPTYSSSGGRTSGCARNPNADYCDDKGSCTVGSPSGVPGPQCGENNCCCPNGNGGSSGGSTPPSDTPPSDTPPSGSSSGGSNYGCAQTPNADCCDNRGSCAVSSRQGVPSPDCGQTWCNCASYNF